MTAQDAMDVRCFVALAINGKNLVVYDRSGFERDMALDAWKWRWAVLSR